MINIVFKILKATLVFFLVLLILFGGYLIFMFVTDYKPDKITSITVNQDKSEKVEKNKPLSIMTFNIGYCGLDDKQDFFMDGGTGSRSVSKKKTLDNLNGIIDFMNSNKQSFIFLQEIDKKSTRSFYVNEVEQVEKSLDGYSSSFAINYKVPWVFLPIRKPHGAVESGVMSLSQYKIDSASRYQYSGREDYPRQLFDLDRCFLETRLPVEKGKELVLINSHLSAYDKGGKVRKQQLGFLKDYIIKEYNKGNYVVVGGDWNHALPETDSKLFKTEQSWPDWLKKLPDDFTPEGFKWGVDKSIPTNRSIDIPYKEGINFTSVIDGFLVSPNIDIKKVTGYDLKFKNADHNPVSMEFLLK